MSTENREIVPERKLWAAVLIQAFDDLNPSGPKGHHYRNKTNAIAWMDSTRESVGSVLWICETLDLDIEDVRKCFNIRRAIYGKRN